MQSNPQRRGYRSATDLTTVRPTAVYPRLSLPPELSGEEAEEFYRVVNTEQADWIAPSALPLLVQYVRHVVCARRIGELLEKYTGRRDTEMDDYVQLLKQQRAESNSLAQLATKLKISPQSTRNNRGNPQRTVNGSPPWEEKE